MTLQNILDAALKRVGLLETTTTFEDQARVYANIVASEILSEGLWWFAKKTATIRTTRRITVTSPTGSYTAGEEVRDAQASYYSATVDSFDSTNNYLYVYSENSVTPTGTLTGQSSGVGSTYSSREFTRTYLLAAEVDALRFFVNETDGAPWAMIGDEDYIISDPDRDDTGDAGAVMIEGLDTDTNTGQVQVAFLPRHATTNETIRYGYYRDHTDWTSGDDGTDLARWFPTRIQPALIFGIARLYKQEKGNGEEALDDQREYTNVINNAKKQNRAIQGNRRFRKRGEMRRSGRSSITRGKPFEFRVTSGSLS